MKLKYKSIIAAAGIVTGAWLTQSCNLDETNPNTFDAQSFWTSQTQFEGNLVALMNQWRGTLSAANFQCYAINGTDLRSGFYTNAVSVDGSTLESQWIVNNLYTNANTQYENYNGLYGLISNCNTFLYYNEEKGEEILPSNCRNYLLGMIYGMRAYCFFQIHKMWGTGPLRTQADVILGNYDPTTLYMEQASVEDFLTQIKSDIQTSLDYFNASSGYTFPYGTRPYYFWTKAATETLAGEVYLWSGKVSTGDHVANPADVTTAKTYFQNVENNYGLSLCPTFNDAINGVKTQNTENIFAYFYGENEASNFYFNYITYDIGTGGSANQYWSCVEQDGTTWSTTAQRLTYYTAPGTTNQVRNGFFNTKITPGQQRFAIKNAYFYQFDLEDSRVLTLQPVYRMSTEDYTLIRGGKGDEVPLYIENFNTDDYYLASCFVWKYHGYTQTGTARMGAFNDIVVYRLPFVYYALAEIANYEGNSQLCADYINKVRERAYGENWSSEFAYQPGSFAENEVAILQDKSKEFFQECQRWWDLRRLTTVKGGTDKDHLVFQPQGCLGYGLDAKLAAHPMWREVSNNNTDASVIPPAVETDVPLLDYATQMHLVLWPLDNKLLGSDPALKQTPGYAYTDPDRVQPWIEH